MCSVEVEVQWTVSPADGDGETVTIVSADPMKITGYYPCIETDPKSGLDYVTHFVIWSYGFITFAEPVIEQVDSGVGRELSRRFPYAKDKIREEG